MDSYVCLSVYLANSLDFARIYYLFYTPIGVEDSPMGRFILYN